MAKDTRTYEERCEIQRIHAEERYIEKMTRQRSEFEPGPEREKKLKDIFEKLKKGVKIKPCGHENDVEYAIMILMSKHHASFENFPDFMNDEVLISELAFHTPTPSQCTDFFLKYVNPRFFKIQEFRRGIMLAFFLNEDICSFEDLSWIATEFGFEEEFEDLLNAEETVYLIQEKLNNVFKRVKGRVKGDNRAQKIANEKNKRVYKDCCVRERLLIELRNILKEKLASKTRAKIYSITNLWGLKSVIRPENEN
ncbi:MAG: hypothetical protein E7374_00585 [Clostridiales bacterium]|nr:hypothetical protein [Clostridiales bacterium]